jgi:phenylalanyl-tRNA synthetase beta chain
LRTDAAVRFEKQVNIDNTVDVLKRAAAFICDLGQGDIAGDVIDVYPVRYEQRSIRLRYSYLNTLAGFNIPKEKADLILSELGFESANSSNDETHWLVPGYKNDCSIEEDLIEEVLRIIGYDQIPISTRLHATLSYTNDDSRFESFLRKIQNIAQGVGFTEVQNNSISSAQLSEQLLPEQREQIIRLMSYSNSGLDSLRTHMLLPLLNTVRNNLNRRELNLRLFEIGKTYSLVKSKYIEQQKLCMVLTGNFEPEYWRSRNISSDLFQLKGFVDVMLQRLGFNNVKEFEFEHASFGYAISLELKKQNLGIVGSVSSKWLQIFDIKQAVYYAELDIEKLFKIASDVVLFKEPSKYPAVRRDLAILLPAEIPFAEVEKISHKNGGANLRDVRLFDIYRDKKLGEGIKSYAVSFTFMDENKTLVDAEVDAQMQRLMGVFESELKATIRK